MGPRVFFFHKDGTVEAVSHDVFHDLRSARLAFPQYAGRGIRYALVTVALEEDPPVGLASLWCGILHFDALGFRDEEKLREQHELCSNLVDATFGSSIRTGPNVIDATRVFARKRMCDAFSWTPTETDLQRLRDLVTAESPAD